LQWGSPPAPPDDELNVADDNPVVNTDNANHLDPGQWAAVAALVGDQPLVGIEGAAGRASPRCWPPPASSSPGRAGSC
jgi:hypothetical protein